MLSPVRRLKSGYCDGVRKIRNIGRILIGEILKIPTSMITKGIEDDVKRGFLCFRMLGFEMKEICGIRDELLC